eukprot:2830980-Ditylum_brightwellii.AAC.1
MDSGVVHMHVHYLIGSHQKFGNKSIFLCHLLQSECTWPENLWIETGWGGKWDMSLNWSWKRLSFDVRFAWIKLVSNGGLWRLVVLEMCKGCMVLGRTECSWHLEVVYDSVTNSGSFVGGCMVGID